MFDRLRRRIVYDDSFFSQMMVLPTQIVIWAILVIPLLIAVFLSLVDWQPISGVDWWQAPFAGVKNFSDALSDRRFLAAFARTVGLALAMVSIELLIGLSLGIFFHTRFPLKRLYTSIVLFPMMLPWVVVGLIFFLIFLQTGPVNFVIDWLAGTTVDWFGRTSLALFTVALGDIWQWTPFIFLVVYSGLSAVPPQPIEAARTLGANEWQILRFITLPTIKPVILIALIIRSLEAFKIFDKIFIMTGGGPGTSTESISVYLYRTGFVFGRLSFASAAALLVLVFVAVVTWLAVRPLRSELEV